MEVVVISLGSEKLCFSRNCCFLWCIDFAVCKFVRSKQLCQNSENSICQELIFGAVFECNRIFFEIVAVSQILETLEIIDITTSTASVQPTGFYCFAYDYKVKIYENPMLCS